MIVERCANLKKTDASAVDAVILNENMLDVVGLELLRKLQRAFRFIHSIILSTSIHNESSADKQLTGLRFTRLSKNLL